MPSPDAAYAAIVLLSRSANLTRVDTSSATEAAVASSRNTKAVWTSCQRPASLVSMAIASAVSAGLPSASPSTSTTVSAATIRRSDGTAPAAFPRACTTASSAGGPPGSGSSSDELATTATCTPSDASSSRRRGDALASATDWSSRKCAMQIVYRPSCALTTLDTKIRVKRGAASHHVQPHYVVGRLAAYDAPMVTVAYEDDRRAAETVVVAGHAVGISGGRPEREQVAGGEVPGE